MKKKLSIILVIALVTILCSVSAFAASAPALSYMQITQISDSTGKSETVSVNQLLTTKVYTGDYIYLTVKRLGYGNSIVLKTGGTTTSYTTYSTTKIVSGSTVIGFLDTLKIKKSNVHGMRFYVESTSLNSPRNTMSDYLSVQYK